MISSLLSLAMVVALPEGSPTGRQSVSLDIYNRDLALVQDVRVVSLEKGTGALDFVEIAGGIFGHTSVVQPLEKGDRISTRDLTFEFDLVNLDKLMNRYIGKWFSFQSDDATYQGRLLSFDDKHLIL